MRSKSAEDTVLEVKDPHAPLLLGYVAPPAVAASRLPVYHFDANIRDHHLQLQQSVQRVTHKANSYRMRGCAGAVTNVHSTAKFFNDLQQLNSTFRPAHLAAWTVDRRLSGLEIGYSNEEVRRYGTCEGAATHNLVLEDDGSEIITEIAITEGRDGAGMMITALSVATSFCKVLDTTTEPDAPELAPAAEAVSEPSAKADSASTVDPESTPAPVSTDPTTPAVSTAPASAAATKQPPAPTPGLTPLSNVRTHTWSRPDDGQWSLRGFFGFTQVELGSKKERIVSLGVVWGKDGFVPVPKARVVSPLSKQFIHLSPPLQKSIRQICGTTTFEGSFLMGNSVAIPSTSGTSEIFNALTQIDYGWRIKEIGFACQDGKLSGLQVQYQTGDVLKHGNYTEATKVWSCEVKTSLVRAKITAGKVDPASAAYIDTVEFIRANPDGQLPVWPLNVSTLRYLGEGEQRVSMDVTELVETAPSLGNKPAFVQGFFGEHSGGLITRLGIVWGRGN